MKILYLGHTKESSHMYNIYKGIVQMVPFLEEENDKSVPPWIHISFPFLGLTSIFNYMLVICCRHIIPSQLFSNDLN